MDFEIIPHTGVGTIKFNMSRGEVRSIYGGSFRSFRRWQDDEPLIDNYPQIGVFCYYDSVDRLEALEFVLPARPIIAGLELLGISFKNAFDNLRTLDSAVEKDEDGAVSLQIGVGVWAPLAEEEPGEPVKTVIAFRPGYYD